ncbi:Putative endonuclease/exonuclease/phosphatase, WD40/YVTN repeat-like-containing domain superfamily [Colletotrichum destructivum]|uniref:Endonuclease/exonuclease/phosphatase, WD40/YVTN repeat-like-containing domain superfamily n=1 Tax=Colletotrichum destructivum TaxID=34406 RepID=A0AAX4I883_9PEZI|nr:Putative endonuclease/exonuclease/phosphatase, WD40/YVTN repeat-like-containing domain superfamily [Colletotrichum destructivum]
MAPPAQNGPDGSSLKPVSSLRAQFENMNKNGEFAAAAPGPSPPRAISPAPKPEFLRDAKPSSETLPVPPRPRDRTSISAPSLPPPLHEPVPRSPGRPLGVPPTLKPEPVKAPSVMVEPPQSPPKNPVSRFAHAEVPAFLNAESGSSTPSTPTSSRTFKIPSRPHTPSLESRRSPRLSASQPPSPPPPRRSVDIRRDNKPAVPPPINRAEKPSMQSQAKPPFYTDQQLAADGRGKIREETSPFSSPPGSPDGLHEPPPPTLPTRPKAHITQMEPPPPQRGRPLDVGFAPPPVHHSIMTKRNQRDQEVNGFVKGQITPQITGDRPGLPALPARPQTIAEPPPRPPVTMKPPPRPPRPGVNTHAVTHSVSEIQPPPKRIVSTPTAHLPPPTRLPGRANTVTDRTSERAAPRPSPPQPPQSVQPAQPQPEPTVSLIPSSNTSKVEINGSTPNFPDPANVNRRPPYIKHGMHEIQTKYDPRTFDVCGDLVCTTGHLTRVWSLRDGELLMSFAHGEGIKATTVAFKPGTNVDEEGKRLWIGNNFGELMEADIATQSVVANKPGAHGRHEVVKIYRHFNELWTLDETGGLLVWGPDDTSTPNLTNNPHQAFRVPKGHSFSMVIGDELWHATGKEIRVFAPTSDGQVQFQVLVRALAQDAAGEVTSGTQVRSQPGKVFFGHADGKVSIYSTQDFACLGLVNLSSWKINSLAGVGDHLWAGFNTGKVGVYDMESTPWAVKKDWQAHEKNPVVKLASDVSSCYRLDRHQVISLGADNMIRVWDGLLQDDWHETEMKAMDTQYCEFQDLKVLCMTWNAGASTPHSLRYAQEDAEFIKSLLTANSSPDILVFGFQELVDLEDKTATAKRFLKVKKKEGSDQERMSHQYRDWRDFLLKSLDEYMPPDCLYHLLHTATLVGLFTCIFVKSTLRDRIQNLSAAEVKRGMGGLHGNKGAIVVRFMVDDSSLCFINCHLAAGQSQANSRHNDVAAILEAQILPPERDLSARLDSYVGGGDGTMILDHELCLLNGDLNYRIDTMSRDTVVIAVKQNNLAKLLERDQLLVAKRRNPAFKLRAFDEMPITFAPTYKYDVGTDNYDTSEKKRSPAWCDRLLYRGGGRIKQIDYKRHEVRVSDHRPVTGRFKFTVKKIQPKARAMAWMDCQQRFEDLKLREINDDKMLYLTNVIGYDEATARSILQPRNDRSLSRSRDA